MNVLGMELARFTFSDELSCIPEGGGPIESLSESLPDKCS